MQFPHQKFWSTHSLGPTQIKKTSPCDLPGSTSESPGCIIYAHKWVKLTRYWMDQSSHTFSKKTYVCFVARWNGSSGSTNHQRCFFQFRNPIGFVTFGHLWPITVAVGSGSPSQLFSGRGCTSFQTRRPWPELGIVGPGEVPRRIFGAEFTNRSWDTSCQASSSYLYAHQWCLPFAYVMQVVYHSYITRGIPYITGVW